jgi:hypothetical protein
MRCHTGETPTKVGSCLRANRQRRRLEQRETPTEVGSTVTYHQIFNVLSTL